MWVGGGGGGVNNQHAAQAYFKTSRRMANGYPTTIITAFKVVVHLCVILQEQIPKTIHCFLSQFTTVEIIRPHCTENPIYVLPEMRLLVVVPNFYIHVSECDLYIPRISLPIWLQQNRQTDPRNI
jgi:hypothetical protein